METEFAFTLPRGYIDGQGDVHREGVMRLSTAFDEIAPLADPRVRQNEAYLAILLLARVVTRLGTLSQVTERTIEGLFSADMVYLQAMYERLNRVDGDRVEVICPQCGKALPI
jgi:hypothetical protein